MLEARRVAALRVQQRRAVFQKIAEEELAARKEELALRWVADGRGVQGVLVWREVCVRLSVLLFWCACRELAEENAGSMVPQARRSASEVSRGDDPDTHVCPLTHGHSPDHYVLAEWLRCGAAWRLCAMAPSAAGLQGMNRNKCCCCWDAPQS